MLNASSQRMLNTKTIQKLVNACISVVEDVKSVTLLFGSVYIFEYSIKQTTSIIPEKDTVYNIEWRVNRAIEAVKVEVTMMEFSL